jgi:hypothetical protein
LVEKEEIEKILESKNVNINKIMKEYEVRIETLKLTNKNLCIK